MNLITGLPIMSGLYSDLLGEIAMKKLSLLAGVAGLAFAALAHAEGADTQATAATTAATPAEQPAGKAQQISELPIMKAEGERIAALMERLAKETDLAERRKIMAELTCAQ